MTWLSGKFKKIVTLCWPADDPRVDAFQNKYIFSTFPYSVLDDQILRVIIITPEEDTPSSYLYLARVYEALDNDVQQVTFAVCAVLPYVVHQVALLPERTGFASLTYYEEGFTITLRVHAWDGSVLKEVSTHAEAAYATLVVHEDLVGICVGSGKDLGPSADLEGLPRATSRVDWRCEKLLSEYHTPFADEIVVWNYRTGLLRRIEIPFQRSSRSPRAPIQHQGNFQFVDQNFIALGGIVSSAYGRPSAVVNTFSLSSEFTRAFSHGENFEMDDDLDVVSPSSSSKPNDILVSYHHRGGRTTIFKRDLLKDIVDSSPDSWDPSGFHMVWSHRSHFRTINGTVNDYFPPVCDNRVLVVFGIEEDDGLCDFVIGTDWSRCVLYIYDFDQERCNALLSDDRSSLEEQIRANNEDAQVTVVQRNYYCSIEDERDMEYPDFKAPPEWQEHMEKRWQVEEDRKEGNSEPPVLEFDEGPSETKENPRLMFTRSLVWLPPDEYRGMSTQQLTLSSCGIIYIPKPGEQGHIFVFDD